MFYFFNSNNKKQNICVIATNSYGEFYLFIPADSKVEQLAWPKMDHLIMYDYDQNTIVYISSEVFFIFIFSIKYRDLVVDGWLFNYQ